MIHKVTGVIDNHDEIIIMSKSSYIFPAVRKVESLTSLAKLGSG